MKSGMADCDGCRTDRLYGVQETTARWRLVVPDTTARWQLGRKESEWAEKDRRRRDSEEEGALRAQ